MGKIKKLIVPVKFSVGSGLVKCQDLNYSVQLLMKQSIVVINVKKKIKKR